MNKHRRHAPVTRPRPRRRVWLVIVLVLVISVSLFQAGAKPTQALFGVGDVTSTIADIPRTIFQFIDKVRDKLAKAFKISNDIAFKNSLNLFVARLQEDILTSLATTGPGQKPLFLTNPKTFFRNVADSAAGDYIDDFTRGVTGERGPGTAFSSSRQRFLISRFLRAQVGDPLDRCRDDCRTFFSVTLVDPLGGDVAPDQQNDHEERIQTVYNQIIGFEGQQSMKQIAETAKDTPVICQNVYIPPGVGTYVPWTIGLGVCTDPDPNNNPAFCQTTAKDCLKRLEEGYNTEYAAAQGETDICLQECKNGVAGAASRAIRDATATDIFASVEEFDLNQTPANVANALKRDTSDFGQLLTAAATLTAVVQEKVTGEKTKLDADVIPRTSRVSEQVLTPKSANQQSFSSTLFGAQTNLVYTGTGPADILKGIASFINSPVGRALFTYFKSKCGLNPDACRGPSQPTSAIGQLLFGKGLTGLAGAKLQFAQVGKVEFITGDPGRNEIGVTEQLTSSGLIDAQFRSAIEDQLTLQQAIDKKLIDTRKTFGFDQNGLQPPDGYPFRALQYLRKFRVTPVGWELAALYSLRFDHRALSLELLTNQFNKCGQDQKVCSNDLTLSCSSDVDCGAGTCSIFKPAEGQTSQAVCSRSLQACSQNSDCEAGDTCGASPYCGLVDPNWVFKAPQTYCRRQGAGEEILTKEFVCDVNNVEAQTGRFLDPGEVPVQGKDSGAPNCVNSSSNPNPDIGRWIIARNTETCADVQSCISENEDGTCQAYGYCVQERQNFKFDGTQCSPENVSCTSYTNDIGREVSYLANTLDSRNCNADVAGCKWYCSAFDEVNARWTCTDPPADADSANFTNKVQSCSQSQQGCSQFFRTTNTTNLLPNSGFESFSGADIDSGLAAVYNVGGVGWTKGGGIQTLPVSPDDPVVSVNNTAAVSVSGAGNDTLSQTIDSGYRLYERSFFASIRAKATSDCSAELRIETDVASIVQPVDITTSWDTQAATIRIPSDTQVTSNSNAVTYTFRLGGCASAGLVVDSAQLEDGPGLSPYKDYGVVNALFMNSSRRQCSADDVGCQAYTRLGDRQVVNGIVRDTNRCSEDKVGCATYILEPINTTPTRPGDPQINIVAPKAQSCSAAYVGCEEYTNLDEVAQGGEGREFYSQVRQCVKPDHPGKSTYYTWIGDAQRGFVLRAFDLLKSNFGGSPTATPPCTSVSFGTSTGSVPQCNDTATTVAAAQLNCTSAANLATNPDCAEYYDSGLNVYYRLRSKTISVSDQCHPYRNTTDQTDTDGTNDGRIFFLSRGENKSCPVSAAGCRAYTGNSGQTTRQLFTDTFESATVENWVGGQPSSQSVNLGGSSMYIPVAGGPVKGSAYLKPSVLQNQIFTGKTYLISFIAAAASDRATTISAAFGLGTGPTFDPEPTQTFSGGGPLRWNAASVPPGPEWQTYTLGPLRMVGAPAPNLGITVTGGDAYVDNVTLTEINDSIFLISQSVPLCADTEVGCEAYRDRAGQSHYLTSFTRLCTEDVVGCEAMIDTHNSTSPFAQTVKGETTPADEIVTLVNNRASYCPATAKGCQAFGQPIYGQDGLLTSFQTVYLRNDPDRHVLDLCLNEERQCRAYTTTDGTTAFFKDPGTNICEYRVTNPEQGGQWFVVGTNFRCPSLNITPQGRPVGRSCSPVCADGQRAGKACVSNADCPGSTCQGNAAIAGRLSNNMVGQCNSDADCDADPTYNNCVYQAGTCPGNENGCSEYRDPSDPVGCRSECPLTLQGGSPIYVDQNCARTQCTGNPQTAGQNCQTDSQCGAGGQCVGLNNLQTNGAPGCRSYTFLRQTLEEQAADCNGRIDVEAGCRPFNDTSNPTLNFRGQ